MGRKNFGKKKKNQHKKQKKGYKSSSKCQPSVSQDQVTCREVAIYEPPDENSDQESDCDCDDPRCHYCGSEFDNGFYRFNGLNFMMMMNHPIIGQMMIYRMVQEIIILSEMHEERMMGNRGRPSSFGFSNRRARR